MSGSVYLAFCLVEKVHTSHVFDVENLQRCVYAPVLYFDAIPRSNKGN